MPGFSPLPQIDLKHIRQHETSQQRAWEELGYILVPDLEGLGADVRLDRRATPDGGIEFSCRAPAADSQDTWAWQSKYLFHLDTDAFTQMTKSVKSALASTPDLVRYAFILPTDRTSIAAERGKGGMPRKGGMQRWSENVTKWTRLAAERGMNVEFVYVGESDVIAALTRERNAGAIRYFFDKELFTEDYFRGQVERETANLGQRYDPAVHVNLEVGRVIDAACRSPRFARRVLTAIDEIQARRRDLAEFVHRFSDETDLAAAVTTVDAAYAAMTEATYRCAALLTTPDPAPLAEFRAAADDYAKAATSLTESLRRIARDLPPLGRGTAPETDATSDEAAVGMESTADVEGRKALKARWGVLEAAFSGATRLQRAAESVIRLLDDIDGQAAADGALLLEGPAGCGKSHLLADAANARVEEHQPALLVLGQHLQTPGAPWPQIAPLLDLNLPGPEILATLQIAARIRGNGRALLAIDAVNEGAGAQIWHDHLAGFLAMAKRFPWVAVVVTIRDTYVPTVLPEVLPATLARTMHPGLEGHEEEALARYAEHYELRMPDLPPLLPELLNPLFLRTMCQSVAARGLQAIPREACSITWVFEGLLTAVNTQICKPQRLDADPARGLVRHAVERLAAMMLDQDTEDLSFGVAAAICQDLYPTAQYSKSLLLALTSEGILLRETSAAGPGRPATDRVRFTYQRLADHIRATVLLERHQSDADLRDAVFTLARGDNAWARVGMIEALVLLTPERREQELALLLQILPGPAGSLVQQPHTASRRAASFLGRELGRAFINTMVWRTVESIRPETLDLLEDYLEEDTIHPDTWLRIQLSLACIPGHPLNAHRLDAALRPMTLPERDQTWSYDVLGIFGEDSNPISRTIDWAWSPSTDPPHDVADLAATFLTWLCTSPNRRLRDTATKALLRLSDNRTGLVADLVTRFGTIDDPYLVERVLAVAAGHALRHQHVDAARDDLKALGQKVYDLVFAPANRPTHLLIRHYARTAVQIIDAALQAQGNDLGRDLATIAPPYGSGWPLTAPPLSDLAKRFDRPDSDYVAGATVLGFDFTEYILDRGISKDFLLPEHERPQVESHPGAESGSDSPPPPQPAAGASLLEQLIIDLRDRAGDPTDPDADENNQLLGGMESLIAYASDLDTEGVAPRIDYGPAARPDPELLGRWIAARILDLGWTAGRFGNIDRQLGYARNSRWAETERFGKKYTWIAFHELLGHLADHCEIHRRWDADAPRRYSDPSEIDSAADLDPSIVLRGDEPPEHTTAGRLKAARAARERGNAWWLVGYAHTVSTDIEGAAWLRQPGGFPALSPLLVARDPDGVSWLVLESHATWHAPDSGRRREDDDRRQLWVRTQANIVPAKDTASIADWAATQNWMGLWMPTPAQPMGGFLGGYPVSAHRMFPWGPDSLT